MTKIDSNIISGDNGDRDGDREDGNWNKDDDDDGDDIDNDNDSASASHSHGDHEGNVNGNGNGDTQHSIRSLMIPIPLSSLRRTPRGQRAGCYRSLLPLHPRMMELMMDRKRNKNHLLHHNGNTTSQEEGDTAEERVLSSYFGSVMNSMHMHTAVEDDGTDGTTISRDFIEFWLVSHAMTCVYQNACGVMNAAQIQYQFQTRDGCLAKGVASALLHSSICWHYVNNSSHNKNVTDRPSSSSSMTSFQVMALSQDTVSQVLLNLNSLTTAQQEGRNKGVGVCSDVSLEWQAAAKFLAALYPVWKSQQQQIVTAQHDIIISKQREDQAQNSSTNSKNTKGIVSSLLGWGVTKLGMWMGVADDPEEAELLALEEQMNRTTIRSTNDDDGDHDVLEEVENCDNHQNGAKTFALASFTPAKEGDSKQQQHILCIAIVLDACRLLLDYLSHWSAPGNSSDNSDSAGSLFTLLGQQDVQEYSTPQLIISFSRTHKHKLSSHHVPDSNNNTTATTEAEPTFQMLCQMCGHDWIVKSKDPSSPSSSNNKCQSHWNVAEHVPHVLAHISTLDAELLFSVLCHLGRIRVPSPVSVVSSQSKAGDTVEDDHNSDNNTNYCSILVDDAPTSTQATASTSTAAPQAQPQLAHVPLSRLDLAIYKLSRTHSRIEQRATSLQAQYDTLTQQALTWKQKQTTSSVVSSSTSATKQEATKRAIHVLKRRKLVESQLDQCRATLWNVEQLKVTLLRSRDDQSLIRVLSSSRDTLARLTDATDVDDVNDLMFELQEEMQHVNDVHSNITTMATAADVNVDEEDLEQELQHLMTMATTSTTTTPKKKAQQNNNKSDNNNHKDDNAIAAAIPSPTPVEHILDDSDIKSSSTGSRNQKNDRDNHKLEVTDDTPAQPSVEQVPSTISDSTTSNTTKENETPVPN
jgi:hypothetical protein